METVHDGTTCRPGKRISLASRVTCAMLAHQTASDKVFSQILRNFALQQLVVEFLADSTSETTTTTTTTISTTESSKYLSSQTSSESEEATRSICQLGEQAKFAIRVIACRAALELDERGKGSRRGGEEEVEEIS
eukprot:763891-Hanusia_phi.AAC.7